MKHFIKHLPYITFSLALISTLGSLYFSEIMKLPPCVLCWYQRIAMYPIVAITAVAIIRKQPKELPYYVFPLSLTGLIIAVLHNLLYYKIIPESAAPCIQGISCTTKFFEWFGFITIPFMSMIAFAFITLCMIIYAQSNKIKK